MPGAVCQAAAAVRVLRTPEERFAGVAGWAHEPRYLEWEGLRLAHVDAGDPDAPPVLLVHGEPTWSYLWRTVVDRLVAAGFRCVAVDHPGFGRSDKPADDAWYTADRHAEALRARVEALDLRDAVLVAHDWGGPLGVKRVCLVNSWVDHEGMHRSEGWLRWVELAQSFEPGTGDLPCGDLLALARARTIDDAEALKAAYDAPFPDPSYKAGVRRFPRILPWVAPQEGGAAWQQRCWEALRSGRWPVHLVFGEEDPIFSRDVAAYLHAQLPSSTLDPIPSASHFVVEEAGHDVAEALLRRLPAP
jgi:haloalkane dehalogenase